jgi:hypothetical protein
MKRIYLMAALLVATFYSFAQVTTNGGGGLNANYPSLASAITALNGLGTPATSVLINVTNDEVAPAGGFLITATGGPFANITIDGGGKKLTASPAHGAGSLTDAVIKVVGGDFIILQNFTIEENPANTNITLGANNMTEWAIALLSASTINGTQNIAILSNTISLDRTYPNSMAIYSNSNHASTTLALSSATNNSGRNRSITINENSISEVNLGIVVVGSPNFMSDNITIGQSNPVSLNTGNSILPFGYSNVFSDYPNVPKIVTGIMIVNVITSSINKNTAYTSNGEDIATAIRGISVSNSVGAVFPVNPAANISINGNVLSARTGVASCTVESIYNSLSNNTANLRIAANIFLTYTNRDVNPIGYVYFIHNAGNLMTLTIENNQYNNIAHNTTGEINFIRVSGSMIGSGTQNIKSNIIGEGGFTRTAVGTLGSPIVTKGLYVTSDALSSPTSTIEYSANNFSTIRLAGVNDFVGIETRDGGGVSVASTGAAKTVSGNIVSNITGVTGGSVTGIIASSGSSMNKHNVISGNMINTISLPATIVGVMVTVSDNQYTDVMNNTIRDLTSTSSTVYGISTDATNSAVSRNQVYNLSSTGLTAGIRLGGVTQSAFRNLIYTISNTANESSHGIWGNMSSTVGAVGTIYNNYIGNILAPAATGLSAVNGMTLMGTSDNSYQVYFNTIYLNASSAGGTFGSTGIQFSPDIANLDLRNTIIVNISNTGNSGANSPANGVSAALRRMSGTNAVIPANYATTSNNNLFWVNPNVSNNTRWTYAEGTTTITNPNRFTDDVKAFFGNREQASFEELPPFISTTTGNANYLHVSNAVQSFVESKAQPIGFITVDYDGDPRNATTPDIGADEINGVLPVNMISFAGQRLGNDNLLTWATATEVNNRGFEVLRSINGVDFGSVGYVATQATDGNSQRKLNYEYRDIKTNTITYYYQLKQIDTDGKTTLSSIVKIDGIEYTHLKINALYPNPAINTINTMIYAPGRNRLEVSIVDMNGRIVNNSVNQLDRGNNTISVNIGNLGKGMYMLKIVNTDGETVVQRFMKQ